MQLSNRLVKDDFWTDTELIKELPPTGRLMYQGLWQLAEATGILENDPMAYKMQLFPGDREIGLEEIQEWTDKLVELGKLIEFTDNGDSYFYIKNFHKHQSFSHPPEPELPLPGFIKYIPNSKKRKAGAYEIHWGKINGTHEKGISYIGKPPESYEKPTGITQESHESGMGDEKECEGERELEKENNVSDKSDDDHPKFSEDSKPLKLAYKLRKLIRENNEYTKLPDNTVEGLQDWADSIRKLHEYGESANDDGKSFSYEEIDDLIKFSQDDQFWKQNILSANKLRKQAGKLMQRMEENGDEKQKVHSRYKPEKHDLIARGLSEEDADKKIQEWEERHG